jgi:hypothetical protein
MQLMWSSARSVTNHELVLALYHEQGRKMLQEVVRHKRRLNLLMDRGAWDGSVGSVGHLWSINGGLARIVAR